MMWDDAIIIIGFLLSFASPEIKSDTTVTETWHEVKSWSAAKMSKPKSWHEERQLTTSLVTYGDEET